MEQPVIAPLEARVRVAKRRRIQTRERIGRFRSRGWLTAGGQAPTKTAGVGNCDALCSQIAGAHDTNAPCGCQEPQRPLAEAHASHGSSPSRLVPRARRFHLPIFEKK